MPILLALTSRLWRKGQPRPVATGILAPEFHPSDEFYAFSDQEYARFEAEYIMVEHEEGDD